MNKVKRFLTSAVLVCAITIGGIGLFPQSALASDWTPSPCRADVMYRYEDYWPGTYSYWSASYGEHYVGNQNMGTYGQYGSECGPLGPPAGDRIRIDRPGGCNSYWLQYFEGGLMYQYICEYRVYVYVY